jgi:DNA-binding transcriptional regulator YbjK
VSGRRLDGRTVRGARARRALVDATLAIIERDGLCGVTHRNVTREAGLPATSAAYHFASINDLLEQALLDADGQASQALEAIAREADPVAAFSQWLVRDFTEERPRVIAEYELFLYAARTPSMRPAAGGWVKNLYALVSTWTTRERAARTICAYVDGLLLQALVGGAAPEAADVEAAIRDLL